MRRVFMLASVMSLSVVGESCAIAKALYVAIVRNSNAPSRAERERIQAREDEFLRTLAHRRVAVLPVAVLGRDVRYDSTLATSIAVQLRDRGIGIAKPSTQVVALPFDPQPNELAIFWTRFQALGARYARHPRLDVDYVLLVDVFGAPDRGQVGAVHVMAVTAGGGLAYHAIWNSRQALYREVEPRSESDVARMVVTALARGVGVSGS
jgi:hypothetical protein